MAEFSIGTIARKIPHFYDLIHPTCLPYLESVFATTIKSVSKIDENETLLRWIQQNGLNDDLMIELKIARRKPVSLKFLRKWCVRTLLQRIIDFFGRYQYDPVTVFPWDLQQQLPATFGSINVSIRILLQGRSIPYATTLDQTIGLFLFARASKSDLQIIMNEVPFTYFDDPKTQDRWSVRDHPIFFPCYRITVNKQEYQFQSTELMQGFVLGALLTNQDHHAYWSNLRRMIDPTTFEVINF